MKRIARNMEDEDNAPNTYLQLTQSVWTESRASTLYSSIVYRNDFLPVQTGSAVPVCVFDAIYSSSILRPFLNIYKFLFYGF